MRISVTLTELKNMGERGFYELVDLLVAQGIGINLFEIRHIVGSPHRSQLDRVLQTLDERLVASSLSVRQLNKRFDGYSISCKEREMSWLEVTGEKLHMNSGEVLAFGALLQECLWDSTFMQLERSLQLDSAGLDK